MRFRTMGASFAQFVDGDGISGNAHGMHDAVQMAANMADPESGEVGEVQELAVWAAEHFDETR